MHDRNIKLTVEYEGTDFAGWQIQPGERTVQGALEEAFADLAGCETRVNGAGRTDAGVHALGQVAHVGTSIGLPADEIAAALNARLQDDVFVKEARDVDLSFHARFDAVSRSYLYLLGATRSPLWRRHRWFVRAELDAAAMRDALEILRGEHDFSSFCLVGSAPSHHRCRVAGVTLEWEPGYGGMLVLRIEADRFLRGMVRSIVGTLIEVGRGKVPPTEMSVILDARDRGAAGPTAPPWGLYLREVRYCIGGGA